MHARHADTARRRTEAGGAVLGAHETATVERILREHPTLRARQRGAQCRRGLIPRVHVQWTEVRTLAVGEVLPPQATPAGPVVQTTNLSYFARRTDRTTFGALAVGERHRRGIAAARRVGAVVDGADGVSELPRSALS